MALSSSARPFRRAGTALAWTFARTFAMTLAAVSAPALSQQPPARPAAQTFFQNPAFGDARLSPSGRHVAMTVSAPGARTRLIVLEAEQLTARVVASLTDADVAAFDWINDERLVFNVRDYQAGQGETYAGPGLFAVSREGGELRTLVERSPRQGVVNLSRSQPAHLSGLRADTFLFAMTRMRNSDDVFVVQPRFDLGNDLEALSLLRLDTRTGRSTAFMRPGNTLDWLLDSSDTPRVTVARDGDRFTVFYLDPASGAWRTLKEFTEHGDDGIWPVAIEADGTLYVRSRNGRDTESLYRFDLQTNALDPQPIVSLPGYDLDGPVLLSRGKVVGLRYQTDAPGTAWFNGESRQIQQKVDALLPATINRITGAARPETSQVLVHAFSDIDPGRYLLFNTATGKLTELGQKMPGIEPARMSPKEMVRYPARDGLPIPAYLTLPKAGPKKNLPLVVLVHGGPWVRGDSWAWNAQVQFLASRGFAVLQPEFRGSTGFGYKHFQAGWKQWGLAMQDDVADGARWAIAQGLADPSRVCIAGASYGGYATLMGLINDSDLYRCGISWAGVTDIDLMYSITWSDFSDIHKRYTMPVLVGDRERDAEQFKRTSPLAQAARIKQPLLMAYGGADRRVPIAHGTRLRNAVEKDNRQVEWVEYTEEGHGWALLKNRVDFWGRVENFLERNIGAR